MRSGGKPINYCSFIRNVDSENIGFGTQYCDGEARVAILHYSMLEPEICYFKALKLLVETFDRGHVVARTFIVYLLCFSNIQKNQPGGFKILSRGMQACSLTLEKMNYVSDFNFSRTTEINIASPTRATKGSLVDY